MCFAIDIAGVVLGRPPQFKEQLFHVSAFTRVDDDGVGVYPSANERSHFFALQHLLQYRYVGGGEDQAMNGVLDEAQPAKARHGFGDINQERVRDRVFREAE